MQENGTSATLFPLFQADIQDMKTSEFQKWYLSASPLRKGQVVHSSTRAENFQQHIIFTILCIIVNHGGIGFKKFEKDLKEKQPVTSDKIELHKTEVYPLPTWNIDESTILGNAEVDQAIVDELELTKRPDFVLECNKVGINSIIFRMRCISIYTKI